MLKGLYIEDKSPLRASLVRLGNTCRMRAVIEKAKAGKPVTLGFLGGSITAGSGAGEGKSYVKCVRDYWIEKFPNSEITCVNAGIGATGSILGVFRMDKDVLALKPDVLVIDHSVNDNEDEERYPGSTKETYECVIRRGLISGAAVVPLCICSSNGHSQRNMNLELAEHYDLPFVSMPDGIYDPLIKSGKYEWRDYSGDSVHPNAVGHAMLAELLCHYFEAVAKNENAYDEYVVPEPHFGASFMDTVMYDGVSLIPESLGGFCVGDTDFYQFKGGWVAEDKGERMIFTLKDCKNIILAFVKDPAENAGSATVTADGKKFEINTFFKNGWGRYAQTLTIFSSDIAKDVTVTVTPNDEGKRFALLRVMAAK